MRKFLEEKFPELKQISDADLREKTTKVMIEAIELSGFDKGQLEKVPFTLLIPGTPISLIDHIRAVTETALRMAEVVNKAYPDRIQINMDYLVVGGLLHDIGKFAEYKFEDGKFSKSDFGRLVRHPFSGAGLALKYGLPAEVIHLIGTHAGEGDKGYRSPASVVLHHADFTNFEALGGKI